MKNKNILIIVGIVLCFILFVLGMLFSEQIPLLTFVGIIGGSGMFYFVFRIVTSAIENQK
ncbi:MAG: hypothetical protein ACQEW5_28930 [Bacillota bacterium]